MGRSLTAHVLYFTAPYQVMVQQEWLAPPAPGQVLVQTVVSAISPGTELLIYRGQAPTDMPTDETITALSGASDVSAQVWLCCRGARDRSRFTG